MSYALMTCRKCRGTGRYVHASGATSTCAQCETDGGGKELTPAAKRLRAARRAVAAQLLSIPATDVVVGMAIRTNQSTPWKPVRSIYQNRVTGTFEFAVEGDVLCCGKNYLVERKPTPEELAIILAVKA